MAKGAQIKNNAADIRLDIETIISDLPSLEFGQLRSRFRRRSMIRAAQPFAKYTSHRCKKIMADTPVGAGAGYIGKVP